MYSKISAAALVGFAASASAHMIMVNPKPYAFPQVVSSPLDPNGDNFPCQLTAGMTPTGTAAAYALGSTQTLSFIGQAVHGGGSCQVSVTYDNPPTANSVFRVIQSIQGGCPAQQQVGNMGDSATAPDPNTYNFTIPSDIPSGDAVIAWTWFNKIGNREMYMNCAPVTLTGSGGNKDSFEKLPEILKANIGNGCSTTESTDIEFPAPGAAVVNMNVGTTVFKGPVGSCGSTAAAQPSPSQGSAGSGSGASASTPAGNPATTPTGAPVSSYSPDGPVFVTSPTATPSSGSGFGSGSGSGSGSGAGSGQPSLSPVPSPAPTPVAQPSSSATPVAQPSAQPNPGSTSGAQTPGSPCANEGAWSCQGTSYQQCGSGTWSAVMPMAAGTECTEDSGGNFSIVAAGTKAKRVAVPFRG